MNDVGKTHEDLERFLADHHLVGAGLRREGRTCPAKATLLRTGGGMEFTKVCCGPGRSSRSVRMA